MLPRKATPIVLPAEFFFKSLSDLIVLEQQNPNTVTLTWLYDYCDINKLCLLPPSHFQTNTFFVITLMKGLRDFQKALELAAQISPESPKDNASQCDFALFTAWNKKAVEHNNFHAKLLQLNLLLTEDLRLGRAREVAEKRKTLEPVMKKMLEQFGDISNLYFAELDLVFAEELLRFSKSVASSSPRFLKPNVNSKEVFQTLVDLSERVMQHLQNFEPNLLSVPDHTQKMLTHCQFLGMPETLTEKIHNLRKRLLSIQTETCEMSQIKTASPPASP